MSWINWIKAGNGDRPKNAVPGGQDNGETLYVARAWYDRNLVPGKLPSSHNSCYIPYGCKEHRMYNYEVLVAQPGAVRWVASRNGDYVRDAIEGGHESSGEKYYIGRCGHNGSIIPGKVQRDKGVCYISYGGKEISYSSYDVLVLNR